MPKMPIEFSEWSFSKNPIAAFGKNDQKLTVFNWYHTEANTHRYPNELKFKLITHCFSCRPPQLDITPYTRAHTQTSTTMMISIDSFETIYCTKRQSGSTTHDYTIIVLQKKNNKKRELSMHANCGNIHAYKACNQAIKIKWSRIIVTVSVCDA